MTANHFFLLSFSFNIIKCQFGVPLSGVTPERGTPNWYFIIFYDTAAQHIAVHKMGRKDGDAKLQ